MNTIRYMVITIGMGLLIGGWLLAVQMVHAGYGHALVPMWLAISTFGGAVISLITLHFSRDT